MTTTPNRASRSGKLNANKRWTNRPTTVSAIAQAVRLERSLYEGGLSRIAREALVREVSVQLSDWSLAERNQIALRFLMLKPYLLSHFLSQSLSLSLYYLIQACYYSVCVGFVRLSWSRWVALGNPQLSPTIYREENGVALSHGSGAHIAWACWLLASHTFCISIITIICRERPG